MALINTHPAGTVIVKGVKHEVHVGDDGQWYAWPGGVQVSAGSKDALAKAITRETRKATVSIAVPFVKLDASGLARPGTATGLHSRNGNVLVRWDDNGEAEQIQSWTSYDVKFTGPLSAEDLAWWTDTRRRYIEAARELGVFEKAHELKLAPAVRKALDAAVSGEDDG